MKKIPYKGKNGPTPTYPKPDRVSYYRTIDDAIEITYNKGVLLDIIVLKKDQISYEGARHHIEYDENDLNKNYFYKIPNPVILKANSSKDFNPLHGLLFIAVVAGLGMLSMLTLHSIIHHNYWVATISGILFTSIISVLYFRNGNR